MMNAYSVLITKVPGGATPVISRGETISELFASAFRGESINGYQIQVNGVNQDATYRPVAGDNVVVAKQVKGNRA